MTNKFILFLSFYVLFTTAIAGADCLLAFHTDAVSADNTRLAGLYDCESQRAADPLNPSINYGLCEVEVNAAYQQALANASDTYDECTKG